MSVAASSLTGLSLDVQLSLALDRMACRLESVRTMGLLGETLELTHRLWYLLCRAACQGVLKQHAPIRTLGELALSHGCSSLPARRRLASAYSRAMAAVLADRRQRNQAWTTLSPRLVKGRPLSIERSMVAQITVRLERPRFQRSTR